MLPMPSSLSARMTRTAISPRFATSTLLNLVMVGSAMVAGSAAAAAAAARLREGVVAVACCRGMRGAAKRVAVRGAWVQRETPARLCTWEMVSVAGCAWCGGREEDLGVWLWLVGQRNGVDRRASRRWKSGER